MLKYLPKKKRKRSWDWLTASFAAAKWSSHILEYLVERKYDQYDNYACEDAADGHLDCLKYLHETAKAPLTSNAVQGVLQQPPRMCTIPPRQQLPITRRLAIRIWRIAHVLIIIIIRIKLVTSEREAHDKNSSPSLLELTSISLSAQIVAQEEDSFITSRIGRRDKERERKSKTRIWCLY